MNFGTIQMELCNYLCVGQNLFIVNIWVNILSGNGHSRKMTFIGPWTSQPTPAPAGDCMPPLLLLLPPHQDTSRPQGANNEDHDEEDTGGVTALSHIET